jgi:aldose sugar dehydrogenase
MKHFRSVMFAGVAVALGIAAALPMIRSDAAAATGVSLERVVEGLDNPWGLAFLNDGTALVTERSGQLRRIDLNQKTTSDPVFGVPDVATGGQGGLLGIAIDPDFATNRLIYMSFSESLESGSATAVFRARLSDDFTHLEDGKVIFRQNRAVRSGRHFGSRLVFDRDGSMFVTTGDRGSQSADAQNPASHIGKVLRITVNGQAAPGNPALSGWAPEVWSIGHRNLQGAALHPETGKLWTVEHGARGGDEVNRPEAGKNYGWPVITYGRDYSGAAIGEGAAKEGMEQPLHYWDPSIAPSGMAFVTSDKYPDWKNSLLVGALAGEKVARLTLQGDKVVAEEALFEGEGRIRDVVQGPDGYIYLLTDDRDGKVVRLVPGG